MQQQREEIARRAAATRWLIRPGNKFAIYAFSNFSVGSDFPETFEGGPEGFAALRHFPVTVGEQWAEQHWSEWLGSLVTEAIGRTNFALVATGATDSPKIFDQDNQELMRRLDELLYGLLLLGVPYYEEGFAFAGANVEGEISIRHFARLRDYHPAFDMPSLAVGPNQLRSAVAFARQLRRIDGGGRDWERLRRGLRLRLLFRASAEKDGGDRLNQLVRSLEAPTRATPGNGNKFVDRVAKFVREDEPARTALREMLEIRTSVEHLDSPLEPLKGSRDQRIALAERRTRQADALARFVFSRIVSSEGLLQSFRTDETIDQFWQKPNNQRAADWGDRLDIAALQ